MLPGSPALAEDCLGTAKRACRRKGLLPRSRAGLLLPVALCIWPVRKIQRTPPPPKKRQKRLGVGGGERERNREKFGKYQPKDVSTSLGKSSSP